MAQAKKTQAEDNGHATQGVATMNGINDLPKELQPDPNYTPTYELRRLGFNDTVKVWRWVRAAQAEDAIRDAAERGGAEAAQYELIDVLMGKVEDEFLPWLLDLAGLSDTDHEEMAADAPFALMADLTNNPDFLRCFYKASLASHGMKRIFSLFSTPQDSREQTDQDSQTPNS